MRSGRSDAGVARGLLASDRGSEAGPPPNRSSHRVAPAHPPPEPWRRCRSPRLAVGIRFPRGNSVKVCILTPELMPAWGGVGTYASNLARGRPERAGGHVLPGTAAPHRA